MGTENVWESLVLEYKTSPASSIRVNLNGHRGHLCYPGRGLVDLIQRLSTLILTIRTPERGTKCLVLRNKYCYSLKPGNFMLFFTFLFHVVYLQH